MAVSSDSADQLSHAGTHGGGARSEHAHPNEPEGSARGVQLPDAERALCPGPRRSRPLEHRWRSRKRSANALAWRRRSFPGPRRATVGEVEHAGVVADERLRRRKRAWQIIAPDLWDIRELRRGAVVIIEHARISDRTREGPTIAISLMPESARASSTWQTIGRLATRCAVIAPIPVGDRVLPGGTTTSPL